MGGGEGGGVYARGEQHSDRVSRYSWTRIGSFICYLCVHAAALSISAYKFAVAHDCVINAQEDVCRRKKIKKKRRINIYRPASRTGIPIYPGDEVAKRLESSTATDFEQGIRKRTRVARGSSRVMAVIS